jgi:hypothetical protein
VTKYKKARVFGGVVDGKDFFKMMGRIMEIAKETARLGTGTEGAKLLSRDKAGITKNAHFCHPF